MSKTISVQCGIYDTVYTVTRHRDGTGTVRAPYINWTGNTGVLDFKNYKIPQYKMPFVMKFFDGQYLCNDDGYMIEDYLF